MSVPGLGGEFQWCRRVLRPGERPLPSCLSLQQHLGLGGEATPCPPYQLQGRAHRIGASPRQGQGWGQAWARAAQAQLGWRRLEAGIDWGSGKGAPPLAVAAPRVGCLRAQAALRRLLGGCAAVQLPGNSGYLSCTVSVSAVIWSKKNLLLFFHIYWKLKTWFTSPALITETLPTPTHSSLRLLCTVRLEAPSPRSCLSQCVCLIRHRAQ